MILDAVRAEIFKLLKNRWSAFWAFGFMPVFALVSGIIEQTWMHSQPALDFFRYAAPATEGLLGLSTIESSVFQLFAIIGGAILFAGEYRWETWRAILPRNARINVMIAKFITFIIALTISILACGVARFLVGLYDAVLTGTAIWPESGGDFLFALLLGFTATFMQVMVSAALVLLVSVLTRSMMAAIIAPFMVLVAVEIGSLRYRFDPADLTGALFPNLAGRSLREMGSLAAGDPDTTVLHLAGVGSLAIIGWFILFAGAALLLFRRQDLSRE
jgi:ABC-2 type transport system permease protein